MWAAAWPSIGPGRSVADDLNQHTAPATKFRRGIQSDPTPESILI